MPINVLIVLATFLSCVVDTVLEACDRLAEGFSSNKHISSLGDLELISVLAEKSTIGIESIDSLMKIRCGRVGRRSCLIATIVLVTCISVIVMFVHCGLMFTIVVVVASLNGERDGG